MGFLSKKVLGDYTVGGALLDGALTAAMFVPGLNVVAGVGLLVRGARAAKLGYSALKATSTGAAVAAEASAMGKVAGKAAGKVADLAWGKKIPKLHHHTGQELKDAAGNVITTRSGGKIRKVAGTFAMAAGADYATGGITTDLAFSAAKKAVHMGKDAIGGFSNNVADNAGLPDEYKSLKEDARTSLVELGIIDRYDGRLPLVDKNGNIVLVEPDSYEALYQSANEEWRTNHLTPQEYGQEFEGLSAKRGAALAAAPAQQRVTEEETLTDTPDADAADASHTQKGKNWLSKMTGPIFNENPAVNFMKNLMMQNSGYASVAVGIAGMAAFMNGGVKGVVKLATVAALGMALIGVAHHFLSGEGPKQGQDALTGQMARAYTAGTGQPAPRTTAVTLADGNEADIAIPGQSGPAVS